MLEPNRAERRNTQAYRLCQQAVRAREGSAQQHGRFSRRHVVLLEQLRLFPKGARDDGPDALEMAVSIVGKAGATSGKPKRYGPPDWRKIQERWTQMARRVYE